MAKSKRKPKVKITVWEGCYDGSLKGLITSESFAHPAKMARGLCERILDHGREQGYWKPGDTLLDPFAGVFTTGILGAYRGYRVLGVELEPRFFRMATAWRCPGVTKAEWLRWQGRLSRNPELCPACQNGESLRYKQNSFEIPSVAPHYYAGNVEVNRPKLETLGRVLPVLAQGDSRYLSNIVTEMLGVLPQLNIDWERSGRSPRTAGAVTSPPYGGNENHDYTHAARDARRLGSDFKTRGRGSFRASEDYGESEGQIGRMNTGDISGALTSPPFLAQERGGGLAKPGAITTSGARIGRNCGYQNQAGSDGNMADMPEGDLSSELTPRSDHALVQGVVTSPAYANINVAPISNTIDMRKNYETYVASGGGMSFEDFRRHREKISCGYGDSPGQIAALPHGTVVDGAILSPPWQQSIAPGMKPERQRESSSAKQHGGPGPQYTDYGSSPGQIGTMPGGTLPHGAVYDDGAITSPAYANSRISERRQFKSEDQPDRPEARSIRDGKYGDTPGQIGSLPDDTPPHDTVYDDGVITSPAYANSLKRRGSGIDWSKHEGRHQAPGVSLNASYGQSAGQLGEMPTGHGPVDGSVTSPPWENILGANAAKKHKDPAKVAKQRAADYASGKLKGHAASEEAILRNMQRDNDREYGQAEGQMGNQQGETYWSAVALVYRQLYELLPSGGAAAIVVKDYVKKKKRVPLCDQTVQLLEAVGFRVVERCHAMLTKTSSRQDLFGNEHTKTKSRKSFFRRLAENKGSPKIDFEEVLWAIKP